jgi:tRNA A37 threonylcarbamoyladenosine dehydratase
MFLINWFDRSKYQFVSCAGLGAVMDEFDLRVEDLNAKAGGLRLCW